MGLLCYKTPSILINRSVSILNLLASSDFTSVHLVFSINNLYGGPLIRTQLLQYTSDQTAFVSSLRSSFNTSFDVSNIFPSGSQIVEKRRVSIFWADTIAHSWIIKVFIMLNILILLAQLVLYSVSIDIYHSIGIPIKCQLV